MTMTRQAAEAALRAATSGWFKAKASAGENGCVEVNFAVPGYVGIRDSKLGDASPILVLTRAQMTAFRALVVS